MIVPMSSGAGGVSSANLILTTGGTIDKHYFDSLSKYQIVDTVVPNLLASARIAHHYGVEEILCNDSLDLTGEDQARIVERVRRAETSHIVITHGAAMRPVSGSQKSLRRPKRIIIWKCFGRHPP